MVLELYQRTVQDTLAVILGAIEEGALVERELEYPRLLTALAEVERALTWVADRVRNCSAKQRKE